MIDPPQITEGKSSNNHVVITHGCGDGAVIGQSVVVPDGDSSTIVANGIPMPVPESCAKVVRFAFAVANICKITGINDMNKEGAINFWAPAVGSKFDGTPGNHAYDFPVYFTVNQDLETNPQPESSGVGQQATVQPSR